MNRRLFSVLIRAGDAASPEFADMSFRSFINSPRVSKTQFYLILYRLNGEKSSRESDQSDVSPSGGSAGGAETAVFFTSATRNPAAGLYP
jgi:hypothetical protein